MLNDECIPNSDREIKENCSKSICTKFMTEIKVFSVIKINGCKVWIKVRDREDFGFGI